MGIQGPEYNRLSVIEKWLPWNWNTKDQEIFEPFQDDMNKIKRILLQNESQSSNLIQYNIFSFGLKSKHIEPPVTIPKEYRRKTSRLVLVSGKRIPYTRKMTRTAREKKVILYSLSTIDESQEMSYYSYQ